MPTITVTVVDNASDRLGRMGPGVKAALQRVLGPLTREMYEDVVDRASAHIHTVGAKPGLYLASIAMGQYEKGGRLGGFVRSGSPLAHLLEGGASPPAHEILPNAAQAMKFSGSAGEVFARAVAHPGATIPPYPAFGPAAAAHAEQIRTALVEAVREGMRAR